MLTAWTQRGACEQSREAGAHLRPGKQQSRPLLKQPEKGRERGDYIGEHIGGLTSYTTSGYHAIHSSGRQSKPPTFSTSVWCTIGSLRLLFWQRAVVVGDAALLLGRPVRPAPRRVPVSHGPASACLALKPSCPSARSGRAMENEVLFRDSEEIQPVKVEGSTVNHYSLVPASKFIACAEDIWVPAAEDEDQTTMTQIKVRCQAPVSLVCATLRRPRPAEVASSSLCRATVPLRHHTAMMHIATPPPRPPRLACVHAAGACMQLVRACSSCVHAACALQAGRSAGGTWYPRLS